MIKAIIFDVGGVLLKGTVESVYKKLAQDLKIDFNDLMKIRAEHITDLRNGKLSAKEFSEIVRKRFSLKSYVYNKWKSACIEKLPVNRETMRIADELKKNYKLAIVSNLNDLYVQINNERMLYACFDVVINSCDVGFAKPDKRIFKIALEGLNLRPEECVFIDDKEENLMAPRLMGFKTILYKNGLLVKELRTLGVEI